MRFSVAVLVVFFTISNVASTNTETGIGEEMRKISKCAKDSWSCSKRRCCKGLTCVAKEHGNGKKCVDKESSTSNAGVAPVIDNDQEPRHKFEMAFAMLLSAIKDKAPILKGIDPEAGQVEDQLRQLQTAIKNIYKKAKSCEFKFGDNSDVSMAVQNASDAISLVMTINKPNGPQPSSGPPAPKLVASLTTEVKWLTSAVENNAANKDCDASDIETAGNKLFDQIDDVNASLEGSEKGE